MNSAYAHKISVIISSYNGSEVLQHLLRSIIAQTYDSSLTEVIVVDDHSAFALEADCKRVLPDCTVLRHKRRRGAAQAKNTGAYTAQSAWLLFLDNDVILPPEFMRVLIMAAEHNQVVCAQPKILFYDAPGVLNSTGGIMNQLGYAWDRGIFERDTGQYDTQHAIFYACSAAMLVRKDIFAAAGGFDARFSYLYEDCDFGWRLRLLGHNVYYSAESRCFHRMSYTMQRGTARVKYLSERNRMIMVGANYALPTLRGLLPQLAGTTARKYCTYRVPDATGRWQLIAAALAAWVYVICALPHIVKKRKQVAGMRKFADAKIMSLMEPYRQVFPAVASWAQARTTLKPQVVKPVR